MLAAGSCGSTAAASRTAGGGGVDGDVSDVVRGCGGGGGGVDRRARFGPWGSGFANDEGTGSPGWLLGTIHWGTALCSATDRSDHGGVVRSEVNIPPLVVTSPEIDHAVGLEPQGYLYHFLPCGFDLGFAHLAQDLEIVANQVRSTL